MTPVPPYAVHTSIQAWKLIEKDYTLRLSLVAHGRATEHLKARNMLFAEARKRGNSSYLAPAWVDIEIADMNRRAEWSYNACCEVWQIQGRARCRAFFRAVFDWCLTPLFATRFSSFKYELEKHQTRTHRRIPQGISTIFGHMKREVDRLRSDWNTRLEIATRDAEHQERLSHELEGEQAFTTLTSVQSGTNKKKPGRLPTRDPDFQALAGRLWMEEMKGGTRVGSHGLKRIASELDVSDFKKPSDYLEGSAAKELKAHNRNYGNSSEKKIMTWTALVEEEDKDRLRAMRKVLSRCAAARE